MPCRPRILVVGSLMMDLVATTARAPSPGETVVGTGFTTAPGGKGSNQAVQCARLGAQVTMVGQVGADDFGPRLVEAVSSSGVDVSHIAVDPAVSTGVAHILVETAPQGTQNRITVIPGANFTLTPEALAWLPKEMGGYDMVLLQFELPMAVVEAVARWAWEAGVPVMVNPAPAAPVSPELLAHTAYLSPNEHEAALIAGLPLRVGPDGVKESDLTALANALRGRGVQNLLVTLGENGSALITDRGLCRVPAVQAPQVADPTAAGDSFVASFCTGLCAGLAQDQALAFAAHAAALTVSRLGAMPSLPTLAQVRDLMVQRAFRGFDPALLASLD